jgi:hypothetical protein
VKLRILFLAPLFLTGCAKDIDNKEAVKAAIEKRVIKTGFDLQTMAVNVSRVEFHGNKAEATASFVPKGGSPSSGVAFSYNLERQKDEWVVTSLQQGSMAGHTGSAGMPGMPTTPAPGTGNQGSGRPSGVPIDPSRPLPPGHPSVGKPN